MGTAGCAELEPYTNATGAKTTLSAREALVLGIDHGAFCVGCCWALMLLMFVVGTGSLGWMLGLAALMAAEKNLPGGRRLRVPLGVALLAGAAGLFVVNAGAIGG